nr:CRISPR-associated helicase Cas3' [Ruegeria sediminis]
MLTDHLFNVGVAAEANADVIGAGSLARAAGLLHDLGKIKPEVQARISGSPERVPHSGEGARYADDKFGPLGRLMAYCIAGHHAGLANGLEISNGHPPTPLAERLAQTKPVELPDWLELPALELPAPLAGFGKPIPHFEVQFFVRMLFSALVDADFVETERFYSPDAPRGWAGSLNDLRGALGNHLSRFGPPEGAVNQLRGEVLEGAGHAAAERPGLFSLTVPTGGGKTLSSLRFALDHVQQHGLRRVIYVVPYTSIIEQTADVFRAALDDADAVLEHHSAFDFQDMEDETEAERIKLAAQNWDRPVVVTTAVQFFESLFANRTSKCRKLHNIACSVIVLDEAQSLPIPFLRPCLAAIKELTRGYGCSAVLCTATQPAIYKEDGLKAPEALLRGETREIAPDPSRLYDHLKRVEVVKLGRLTNAELAQRVRGRSALVIVNNKRQARALYDDLRGDGVFHLTTNMTASHRATVLGEVRRRLQERPVLLIATALVEAGVDLDFPEVWRAVAGIDSITQAAGRCNRNGKLERGQVFVFKPEEGYPPPRELQRNAEIACRIMAEYADPLSPDAVNAYFRALYWSSSADLDSRRIMGRIGESGNQLEYPFADIAADFSLIEDYNKPLILGSGPWGMDEDAQRLLSHSTHAGAIAHALQRYTVGVSPKILGDLIQIKAASAVRQDEFGEQFVVLDNVRLYDNEAGFSPEDPEYLGFLEI